MTKVTVADESGGQHDLQLFKETYIGYIELSKYLFGSKNPIYDINEMPETCKFLGPAKEIAKSIDVNWEKMTHEESNRIMLALLEDTYKMMAKVGNKSKLVVEVKLKVTK